MKSFKPKKTDPLKGLLLQYFNENEIAIINKQLTRSTTKQEKDFEKFKPGDQRQLLLQPVTLDRVRVDLLVTFAERKLENPRMVDLLINLGNLAFSFGELPLAYELTQLAFLKSEKEETLSDFAAHALLAQSNIYSKQALWKETADCISKAKKYFNKTKNLKGIAKCENLLGTLYAETSKLKKAESHFAKCLAILNTHKDKSLAGMLEINMGIINNIKGNFDLAFSFFQRALTRFEQLADVKRIAEIRHNLGMVFTKKKEYNSALVEFDLSLAACYEVNYLSIMGMSYLSKSYLYTELKDFHLAEALADKAMDICYKVNDRLSIAEVYKVKGIIHRNFGNREYAENYLLTSLRLNKELSSDLNYAETSYELGLLYSEWKKVKEAQIHFATAVKYYSKIGAVRDADNVKELLE